MCEIRVAWLTHKDTQLLAGSYMEVVADKDSFQKVDHEDPARFQCRGKQVLSVLTKQNPPNALHVNLQQQWSTTSQTQWVKGQTDQAC